MMVAERDEVHDEIAWCAHKFCRRTLNLLYLIECFVQGVGAESSLILIELAESHQTARLAQTTVSQ